MSYGKRVIAAENPLFPEPFQIKVPESSKKQFGIIKVYLYARSIADYVCYRCTKFSGSNRDSAYSDQVDIKNVAIY